MMKSAKWTQAVVYQKMGRYQQAAELYEQVMVINDTLTHRQALNNAQELAAVYHTQEQQLALEQEKSENTRNRLIIIIVLAVLLGVAAYMMAIMRKNRIINIKNSSLAEQITDAMVYKELYNKLMLRSALQESGKGHDNDTSGSELDLNGLDDEQLFQYINDVIVRERLFLDSKFEGQTIMDRFQLSKERVGAAFAKGSQYTKLTDYTQGLRLEYATLLLSNQPDKSVRQVADESGFSSYDYFGKCFRKRFGMTPTEFRTSAKKDT
ncbi:MAG: helix-turn-helix domain-containing protein [Prevotella sp.]|nr:helix-turn-helix domain-containing protein [Prevotella sp.]